MSLASRSQRPWDRQGHQAYQALTLPKQAGWLPSFQFQRGHAESLWRSNTETTDWRQLHILALNLLFPYVTLKTFLLGIVIYMFISVKTNSFGSLLAYWSLFFQFVRFQAMRKKVSYLQGLSMTIGEEG